MVQLNPIESRIYNIIGAGMRSILVCQEEHNLPGGTLSAYQVRNALNDIIDKYLPSYDSLPNFDERKVSRYMAVWRILEIEADLYLAFMLCEKNRYKVLRRYYQDLMVELATFRNLTDNTKTGLCTKMPTPEIENHIFEFFCHLEAMRPLGVTGKDYKSMARQYAIGKPFLTTPKLITRQFIRMDVDRIRMLIERYGYDRALGRISNSKKN